jgi:hypothetical protein
MTNLDSEATIANLTKNERILLGQVEAAHERETDAVMRAEKAEAALARVQALAERWSKSFGDKAKWASAQVLEAAIREPKPKPWDNCTNPEPMDGIHYGYCRNCRGMLIANDAEETDDPDSLLVMVHPPKGWKP